MARTYDQMIGYVFRRNSLRFAARTLVPTLGYCLSRTVLPPSDKPALCTMNILPPMMTVWYHLMRKNIGDAVDTVIFDCTGTLDAKEFPQAHILPFLNFYAATKCNEFIRSIARNRRIAWICDDDMFLMSGECLQILEREFAVPNTASVSFRPREWWEFEMDGKRITPSSSYCLALNREIFMRERLSLSPEGGNPHPGTLNRPPRRYDTFDKANEILLKKGYRCAIVSAEERERCVAEFSGLSGAVMLLHHFKDPEQTLRYFTDAPQERWSGNLLFGLLSAMLSVVTVQELYTKLKGKPYPLPSLPEKNRLLAIIEQRRTFIRPDQTPDAWMKTSERLHASL